MTPVIDTGSAARRIRARPGAARKPAGVRQNRRQVLTMPPVSNRGADGVACRSCSTAVARRYRRRLPARCCGASTASGWPTGAARCCAGSGPGCRSIAPAAPILRAAFPEKSAEEIEAHTRRRLGQSRPLCRRFRASRSHARSYDPAVPGPADIEYQPKRMARFRAAARRRQAGAACLPRISPIGSCRALVAHRYGSMTAVLYRRPNLAAASPMRRLRSAPAAWAR